MLEKAQGTRWSLTAVAPTGRRALLTVRPVEPVTVTKRRFDNFPEFQSAGGGWQRGVRLPELITQECSCAGALDPASIQVETADGTPCKMGLDYDGDTVWAAFGRLPGGRIKAGDAVLISYRYWPQRLDSVVLTADDKLQIREGIPAISLPTPPELNPGERRIGNIFFSERPDELSAGMLFPVLEAACPEIDLSATAARLLPKTLAKLRNGETLRILAWGDSVTVGTYLPSPDCRWQCRFVERLQRKFPGAHIELDTIAWGGKNTNTFLETHPGYEELVLPSKPDLIISEFVNDAGLSAGDFDRNYRRFLKDFAGIGAEWLILTPHYIRPDWMGLDRQNDIDDDPRPYVKALREFAAQNHIALADAAWRYGRLWRQGIPYNTLMSNSINHPCPTGMEIFADALSALFPAR